MSISATTSSGSSWGMGALQGRKKPPELTKDQLTQLETKLKSEGKDTSNLDKIISNFDKLDTNGDSKISVDELKSGASQYGINLPKHGHRGHPPGPPPDQDGDGGKVGSNQWGPPPGLLSNGTSASNSASGTSDTSSTDANSWLLKLLEKFAGSDPTSTSQDAQAATSSVNIAA